MTEKELRKLTRKQLLELLLKQIQYSDALEEELRQAKQKIEDRNLMQREAGSIASASLKLNGVFEAAEAAAAQYLENIAKLNEDHELVYERAKTEAKEKADALVEAAQKICKDSEQKAENAEKRLKEIEEKIKELYIHKRLLDEYFSNYSFGGEAEETVDDNEEN